MPQPSSKIQLTLAATLLSMLRSPDLTPEDAEWLQQFALRTISEFNLRKEDQNLRNEDKKEAPEELLAA